MRAYRNIVQSLVPKWLSAGEGGKVLYTLHLVADAFLERARLGLIARFPSYAPEDALPLLSRDRKIMRGLNEPQSSYAVRLCQWLDTHKTRGNPFVLLEQLRSYLQSDVTVRTVDQNGNWFSIEQGGAYDVQLSKGQFNWDSVSSRAWGQFWVVVYGSTLWTAPKYGDGSVYSKAHVWGLSATPSEIDGLRTIVRQCKPAHAICRWIIVSLDDSLFHPGTALNGLWEKDCTESNPRLASRNRNARYIHP